MSNPGLTIDDVEDKRKPRVGERGNPGKARGLGNKTTREMREIAMKIVSDNPENIARWLLEVAEGKPSQVIVPQPELGIAGGVIPGIDPDPAKAIDLLVKIAEFAAPKATRTPVAGDPDSPALLPVVNLTIGGKEVDV